MRTLFVTVLSVLGLLLVQSVLVPYIAIFGGIVPDLLLIYMVIWSSSRSRVQSVALGFWGGLAQDLTTNAVLGIHALSKSLGCALAASWKGRISDRHPLAIGMLLFGASLVQETLVCILTAQQGSAGFPILMLRYGLPTVFVTVVLGICMAGAIFLWTKGRKRV
jgi:rod shape-determining protein MreD